MKKSILSIALIVTTSILITGCSTLKGTVYKEKSGNYKATYSASNEKSVRKALHFDAAKTCKDKHDTKNFIVIKEDIVNMEDDSKKDGIVAVAGNAVSLAGKYFGAESVRGSLTFQCE